MDNQDEKTKMKGYWKYIIPAMLAVIQIGSALYKNFHKDDDVVQNGTQRFEVMLSNPSITQSGDNEFRCYDITTEDAKRFFYRMAGGNKIRQREDDAGLTMFAVYPGGKDSLLLFIPSSKRDDSVIAVITLPGKNGVRKRVVGYSYANPNKGK
ncbi:hypothetical protein [Prevotella merdae]|uniref:hypothetical protein n=1 Tax=Prevotella merdae TaxID=2079531 RepID=UPI00356705E5